MSVRADAVVGAEAQRREHHLEPQALAEHAEAPAQLLVRGDAAAGHERPRAALHDGRVREPARATLSGFELSVELRPLRWCYLPEAED